MEQILIIVEKVLITTYTICLPLVLGWIREIRKEKRNTNDYMQSSVTSLKSSVDNLSSKIEFNEAMTSRYRIIRAADEIRNGSILSQDHLDQLGEDIDIYRTYCETHPDYKNHKGQASMRLVLEYEKKVMKGTV